MLPIKHMKTKPAMDPAAAFPDATHQPAEADLKAALGPVIAPIKAVFAALRAAQPTVAMEWKYSERSGWHQIHSLKKRRLCYLVPRHEDFRLALILGDKALALLKQGPFAKQTTRLLKTAKRYPEGTAFSFDRRNFDPDLIAALLAAKVAH